MSKKYKYQKYFTYDDHRYVVRADTQEDLAVKEYKKRQELEGKVKTVDREMFVRDWIDEWLVTYKEPTVAAETYNGYVSIIRKHIKPNIGAMKMKAVKPLHCQRILNKMSADKMATSTIELCAILLNEIFREAEDNYLVLKNPAHRLRVPEGTKCNSRALTEYEEAMCLMLADEHPFGIIIKVMFYCGLRIGEACALRWSDVDLEKNIIHVQHTVKRLSGHIGKTKTPASVRDVPIPANFAAELKEIQGPSDTFLYRTNKRDHANTYDMNRAWYSFKNDLNILMGCDADEKGNAIEPYRVADDLRPHYFRHTYCTHLQDAGVPINIARQFMGHTSITTTSKIYTHATDTSFESARNMIDNFSQT